MGSTASRLSSLLLVATLVFGQLGCPPVASVRQETPPEVDTTLGIGDTIEVRVYGENDLSGSYRVSSSGAVTLPLAGDVQVLGLEPQKAAKAIEERLAQGILRNPQVTMIVKEQTSKRIVVIGQVVRPGTLTYSPALTAVEAITMSGGFTGLASKNSTTLTRVENGQKVTMRIPIEDITQGRAKNVYLRPGDILSIPERLF